MEKHRDLGQSRRGFRGRDWMDTCTSCRQISREVKCKDTEVQGGLDALGLRADTEALLKLQ